MNQNALRSTKLNQVFVSGAVCAESLDGSRNDWTNTLKKNPLISFC